MPTASKRSNSHQTIHRQQQKQLTGPRAGDGYDDYVYYPYYSKAAPEDGRNYAEESDQYEERPAEYYSKRAANGSAQQPLG